MNPKIPSILLVEDDQLDVINFQRALGKINLTHNLYHAKNGEEALEILKGTGKQKIDRLPDLVLLDINMPKMNGFEFLNIIRQEKELKDLKVFVITTSAENEDKVQAQKYGIAGYVVKPFGASNSTKDNFNLLIDLMNLKSV
jgi:CheY-like chemotaxis protein